MFRSYTESELEVSYSPHKNEEDMIKPYIDESINRIRTYCHGSCFTAVVRVPILVAYFLRSEIAFL